MPNHKTVTTVLGTAAAVAAGFLWLSGPAPARPVLSDAPAPAPHATTHARHPGHATSGRPMSHARTVRQAVSARTVPAAPVVAVPAYQPTRQTVTVPARPASTTPTLRPGTTTTSVAAPVRTSPTPVRTTPTPAPARPANVVPAGTPSTAPTCNSAYPELTGADQWLFDTLNAERAAHGKPALRWDPRLHTSACLHNVAMGNADTMSHQLGGEAGLGDRVSAQGVRWTIAAENIGWDNELGGGGVVATTAVNALMMNEGPGGDHYDNIMCAANYVGVSVVLDQVHGKVWITEDFAQE